MNEQLEEQLRKHLRSIDGAQVHETTAVSAAAERIIRRQQRRRRGIATVSSVVLVMLASLALWTSRAHAPSVAPAVTDTPSPTTREGSTTTVTEGPTATVAASSAFAPIAPDPRGIASFPAAVWTGTEVLIVGGLDPQGQVRAGASAYDPATDTWRTLAAPPDGSLRMHPVVAWTGSEMLVIGGGEYDGTQMNGDGLAYNPSTDSWRSTGPLLGFVTDRSPTAWTGRELLVWPVDQAGNPTANPVGFDVATGAWRQLPTPPIEPRQQAASVWTGQEWIIWGGQGQKAELADGASFNPTTNTWKVMATSPLAARRTGAVWTGSEMLVAAGSSGGDPQTGNNVFAMADGAAYDPAANSWRKIRDGFAHPGFLSVWTGHQMIMFAKAGAVVYDASTDQWIDMCCSVNEGGAGGGTPVWTGSVVVLVGSNEPSIGGQTFTLPTSTTAAPTTPSTNPPLTTDSTTVAPFGRVVDMSFVDAQQGWVLVGDDTSTTNLLATSDGGQTFETVAVDAQQALHVTFADPTNGWLYGDPSNFQSTHDGGATWHPVDLAKAGMIDGVRALVSDAGTVTIISGIAAADQNVNWTVATSPVDTDDFSRIGIDFQQGAGPANEFSLAASGGNIWIVYNDRVVTATARTLHGTKMPWTPSWSDLGGPATITANSSGALYAIVDAGEWTGGSGDTQLYVSKNNGDIFHQLIPPTGVAAQPLPALLNAGESDLVLIVGHTDGSQSLYRSNDGGTTWQLLSSLNADQALDQIVFADSTTAYAVQRTAGGEQSQLIKSVDGGATWNLMVVA
jgi:photosystem II stability/assembly factor-like uncharacterized protein